MSWFSFGGTKSPAEQQADAAKAKQEAEEKTMQAEIRQLLQVGTQVAMLEAMYAPHLVAKVQRLVQDEKAVLQVAELQVETTQKHHWEPKIDNDDDDENDHGRTPAHQSSMSPGWATISATLTPDNTSVLDMEIRGLYEVGTRGSVLEAMFSPHDVARVVTQIRQEEQQQQQLSSSPAMPGPDPVSAVDAEIRELHAVGTSRLVLEAMFPPERVARVLGDTLEAQDEPPSHLSSSTPPPREPEIILIPEQEATGKPVRQPSPPSQSHTTAHADESLIVQQEIRAMHDVGTSREVLEAMFPPEHVATVLEQIEAEKEQLQDEPILDQETEQPSASEVKMSNDENDKDDDHEEEEGEEDESESESNSSLSEAGSSVAGQDEEPSERTSGPSPQSPPDQHDISTTNHDDNRQSNPQEEQQPSSSDQHENEEQQISAEIRALYEAGTDVAVLQVMFPPDQVARVIDAIEKEPRVSNSTIPPSLLHDGEVEHDNNSELMDRDDGDGEESTGEGSEEKEDESENTASENEARFHDDEKDSEIAQHDDIEEQEEEDDEDDDDNRRSIATPYAMPGHMTHGIRPQKRHVYEEIKRLHQIGTSESVLKAMFAPEDVVYVLDGAYDSDLEDEQENSYMMSGESEDDNFSGSDISLDDHNENGEVDEANVEPTELPQHNSPPEELSDYGREQRDDDKPEEMSTEHPEADTKIYNEIKRLYKAGTPVEVLEAMHHPDDVAYVIEDIQHENFQRTANEIGQAVSAGTSDEVVEPNAYIAMSDQGQPMTTVQVPPPPGGVGSDASSESGVDEEELAELEMEIRELLKVGTDPSVLDAMYKPKTVKRVVEMLDVEKSSSTVIIAEENRQGSGLAGVDSEGVGSEQTDNTNGRTSNGNDHSATNSSKNGEAMDEAKESLVGDDDPQQLHSKIRKLQKAGTRPSVMNLMFDPATVASAFKCMDAIESDDDEENSSENEGDNSDVNMEAVQEAAPEIRQLLEVGTKISALNAMYDPAIVAKVIELTEMERRENDVGEDQNSVIRKLQKAGTRASVLSAMYSPEHIASAMEAFDTMEVIESDDEESSGGNDDLSEVDMEALQELEPQIRKHLKFGTTVEELNDMFDTKFVAKIVEQIEREKQEQVNETGASQRVKYLTDDFVDDDEVKARFPEIIELLRIGTQLSALNALYDPMIVARAIEMIEMEGNAASKDPFRNAIEPTNTVEQGELDGNTEMKCSDVRGSGDESELPGSRQQFDDLMGHAGTLDGQSDLRPSLQEEPRDEHLEDVAEPKGAHGALGDPSESFVWHAEKNLEDISVTPSMHGALGEQSESQSRVEQTEPDETIHGILEAESEHDDINGILEAESEHDDKIQDGAALAEIDVLTELDASKVEFNDLSVTDREPGSRYEKTPQNENDNESDGELNEPPDDSESVDFENGSSGVIISPVEMSSPRDISNVLTDGEVQELPTELSEEDTLDDVSTSESSHAPQVGFDIRSANMSSGNTESCNLQSPDIVPDADADHDHESVPSQNQPDQPLGESVTMSEFVRDDADAEYNGASNRKLSENLELAKLERRVEDESENEPGVDVSCGDGEASELTIAEKVALGESASEHFDGFQHSEVEQCTEKHLNESWRISDCSGDKSASENVEAPGRVANEIEEPSEQELNESGNAFDGTCDDEESTNEPVEESEGSESQEEEASEHQHFNQSGMLSGKVTEEDSECQDRADISETFSSGGKDLDHSEAISQSVTEALPESSENALIDDEKSDGENASNSESFSQEDYDEVDDDDDDAATAAVEEDEAKSSSHHPDPSESISRSEHDNVEVPGSDDDSDSREREAEDSEGFSADVSDGVHSEAADDLGFPPETDVDDGVLRKEVDDKLPIATPSQLDGVILESPAPKNPKSLQGDSAETPKSDLPTNTISTEPGENVAMLVRALERKVESLKTEKEAAVRLLENRIDVLSVEKEEALEFMGTLRKSINDLRQENKNLDNELKDTKRQIEDLQYENSTLGNALKASSGQKGGMNSAMDILQRTIEELKEKNSELVLDLKASKKESIAQCDGMDILQNTIKELRAKCTHLEEQVQAKAEANTRLQEESASQQSIAKIQEKRFVRLLDDEKAKSEDLKRKLQETHATTVDVETLKEKDRVLEEANKKIESECAKSRMLEKKLLETSSERKDLLQKHENMIEIIEYGEKKKAELSNRVTSLEDEISALKFHKDDLDQEMLKLRGELDESTDENDKLSQKISTLEADIQDRVKILKMTTEQLSEMQAEKQQIEADLSKREQTISDMVAEKIKLTTELHETQRKKAELEDELDNQNQGFTDMVTDKIRLTTELAECQKNLAESRKALESANQRNAELVKELQSANSSKTNDDAIIDFSNAQVKSPAPVSSGFLWGLVREQVKDIAEEDIAAETKAKEEADKAGGSREGEKERSSDKKTSLVDMVVDTTKAKIRERERDRDRDRHRDRHRDGRDRDRDRDRRYRDRERDREKDKDRHHRDGERDRERDKNGDRGSNKDREKEKDKERPARDKDKSRHDRADRGKERDKDKEKSRHDRGERDKERDKEKEKGPSDSGNDKERDKEKDTDRRDRDRHGRDKDKAYRDRERDRDKDNDKDRERRDRDKDRERRDKDKESSSKDRGKERPSGSSSSFKDKDKHRSSRSLKDEKNRSATSLKDNKHRSSRDGDKDRERSSRDHASSSRTKSNVPRPRVVVQAAQMTNRLLPLDEPQPKLAS